MAQSGLERLIILLVSVSHVPGLQAYTIIPNFYLWALPGGILVTFFLVCAFQRFSRPLIQSLLGFHETEGLCRGYCPDGAIPQSLEPLSYQHLLIPHARC